MSRTCVDAASALIIQLLYRDIPQSEKPVTLRIPTKTERNEQTYQRYMAGERAAALAVDYWVSLQRFHTIVRNVKVRSEK